MESTGSWLYQATTPLSKPCVICTNLTGVKSLGVLELILCIKLKYYNMICSYMTKTGLNRGHDILLIKIDCSGLKRLMLCAGKGKEMKG